MVAKKKAAEGVEVVDLRWTKQVTLPSEEWLAEAIEVTALVSPENARRLAREIVERAAG